MGQLIDVWRRIGLPLRQACAGRAVSAAHSGRQHAPRSVHLVAGRESTCLLMERCGGLAALLGRKLDPNEWFGMLAQGRALSPSGTELDGGKQGLI